MQPLGLSHRLASACSAQASGHPQNASHRSGGDCSGNQPAWRGALLLLLLLLLCVVLRALPGGTGGPLRKRSSGGNTSSGSNSGGIMRHAWPQVGSFRNLIVSWSSFSIL